MRKDAFFLLKNSYNMGLYAGEFGEDYDNKAWQFIRFSIGNKLFG